MEINIDTKGIIDQLLYSPIAELAEIGKQAQQLTAQLEARSITVSEYQELISDLQSLRNINENMMEVERWREIVETVKILNLIRQWAPLL